jgi:hypothetical protein
MFTDTSPATKGVKGETMLFSEGVVMETMLPSKAATPVAVNAEN